MIAYHEAGHVVMAIHKGAKVKAVSIDLPDFVADRFDADGLTLETTWPSRKGTRKNKGLVLLAGMISVDILSGCRADNYGDDRNRSDLQKFSELWPTKEDAQGNLCELYAEAAEFLFQSKTWEQVKIIAETLLKRRWLLDFEVKLYIESVVNEKGKRALEDYLEIIEIAHRRKRPR